MRCFICNRVLEEPRYNADHKDYEPCDPCLAIIQDAVGNFTDKPSADEEDFGYDPVWDELYPTSYDPLSV